ncbi:MAG: hypothetical protein JXB32_02095 [Deltaproteobacteria bacterium]|nr:hypothetical protein [Deltaproteobacteria bacterium]
MNGRRTRGRAWMLLLLALPVPAAAGCDLTMTLEPLTYEELGPTERAAVDRIFARVQGMDARLRSVTSARHTLGVPATDRDAIDVSVVDLWVMLNVGDDRLHLSVWENLSAEQQQRFAGWFGETIAAAGARYRQFFYDFVALHLAGMQAVFAIQGVDWVYLNRSMFNVDRDAERLAATYLAAADTNLSAWARGTCGAIRTALEERFGAWYSREGYAAHVRELTDPRDPSGQIYMICRHFAEAETRRVTFGSNFAAEIEILRTQHVDPNVVP